MDNARIQYLSRVIQDLRIEITNLRLENVDIKTQCKKYQSYAEQLEGQLILLKKLQEK